MTISTAPVFDWRRSGLDWDAPPYEAPSPNLLALLADLVARFGGGSMGIHGDRPTTSGAQSEHSWGAALDWGWNTAQIEYFDKHGITHGPRLTPEQADAVLEWIVDHSAELGVQAMVAIGRAWKSDRTNNGARGWKPYNSGYTGHTHIVTNYDTFFDATQIADRITTPPTPDPEEDDMPEIYLQLPPAGHGANLPWFTCQGGAARPATQEDLDTITRRRQETGTDAGLRYDLLHESVLGRRPA